MPRGEPPATICVEEKEATGRETRWPQSAGKLPMVRVEKNYVFAGLGGQASLLDLFEGRRQALARLVTASRALHDADAVHLYLEESFSFRVATPEAAVALTP